MPLAGQRVVDRYNSKSEGGLPTFKESEKISSTFVPLFLTWAIMGLWHGANWTFVFWGVYHAILVLGHRILAPVSGKFSKTWSNIIGWMITMPLIMLSWIPFRASNMQIVTSMFAKLVQPSQYLFLGMRENIYIIAALLIVLVIAAYLIDKYLLPLINKYYFFRWSLETVAFAVVFLVVIIFLRPITQFIYFQF